MAAAVDYKSLTITADRFQKLETIHVTNDKIVLKWENNSRNSKQFQFT